MKFQLVPTSINIPVQDSLVSKVHRFPDVEQCGFILQMDEIIAMSNIHPEPDQNFQMAAEDYHTVLRTHGYTGIKGVWHTHPSEASFPSPRDLEALDSGYWVPGWKYWIVTKQGVFEWEFNFDNATVSS